MAALPIYEDTDQNGSEFTHQMAALYGKVYCRVRFVYNQGCEEYSWLSHFTSFIHGENIQNFGDIRAVFLSKYRGTHYLCKKQSRIGIQNVISS